MRASRCFRFIALALAAYLTSTMSTSAQASRGGRIVGTIDGVRFDGEQYVVHGWACQQGVRESIAVHIYADNSPIFAGKADLESEAAVNRACGDSAGGKHRFWIALSNQVLETYRGKKLIIHGIRAMGSVENAALDGSGTLAFPDPVIFRTVPARYPTLPGTYRASDEHPRVFTTKAELDDLVRRINTPGTFSAERFTKLAARIRDDLAAKADWDAVYAGCDMEIYLRGFAYEPKPAYGNDRSDDQLRSAMNVRPGLQASIGAAVVAARLSLFATLRKAGVTASPDAPSAEAAIALAKRILLAWADRGFRDEQGHFRTQAELCDLYPDGKPKIKLGGFVGALTYARGVVYSVHAQDLLEGVGALLPSERARLDAFHRDMQRWILSTHNQEINSGLQRKYRDETYNNQSASHITALLALARLLDDRNAFEAALYGGEGATAVRLPWVMLFDVIYGPEDRPFLRISPNSSDDPLKSHPAFTTKVVAAGEINDRYRNDNPLQGIGYPMGTLEWLFDAAEMLRNAGLDPYGYRGAHDQSIETATAYYACYARDVGFNQMVTTLNAEICPDYQQYVGKIVNAVAPRIVIGAYRFSGNAAITALDDAAKKAAASGPFALDPILFGKWRN